MLVKSLCIRPERAPLRRLTRLTRKLATQCMASSPVTGECVSVSTDEDKGTITMVVPLPSGPRNMLRELDEPLGASLLIVLMQKNINMYHLMIN